MNGKSAAEPEASESADLSSTARLPRAVVVAVVALCLIPAIVEPLFHAWRTHSGEASPAWDQWETTPSNRKPNAFRVVQPIVSGPAVTEHLMLEWTGVCIAFFTAVLAFQEYRLSRNVATPIIGCALLFSGALDACNLLPLARAFPVNSPPERFIPFTWALSRTFHSLILLFGTGLYLWRRRHRPVIGATGGTTLLKFVFVVGLGAYSIVQVCAVVEPLPESLFPNSVVPRPWDAVALIGFLIGGGLLFPRFYRARPSVFAHSLTVAVVPAVAAQLYAAFGAHELFDASFHSASFLKVVAYGVPLVGLIVDAGRALESRSRLHATEEKLSFARTVQLGMLPDKAPRISGFDLAGRSRPAGAVGGDFFDFMERPDGRCLVVVADVSGHDLGAALVMAQVRAYLRAVCRTQEKLSQMTSRLNEFLARECSDRHFVSAVLVELVPDRDEVCYVTAGHDAQLVTAGHSVLHLPPVRAVLGMLGQQHGRIETDGAPQNDDQDDEAPVCSLSPGAVLLLTTDGITEAADQEGRQFGSKRVAAVAAELIESPAATIAEAVFLRGLAHTGGREPTDDRTVVVIQRSSTLPTQ